MAVFLGAALSPSLTGCVAENGALGRVAEAIGIEVYPLSEESVRELNRFNTTFAEHAKDPNNTRQLKHFRDAYKRVRVAYVHPPDDRALIDAAIEGVLEDGPGPRSVPPAELAASALDRMLASLDPHSTYLDPDELQESKVSTSGEFGGLGIQVTVEDGKIKVIAPIEDTPADAAGVKAGDLITHLDGVSIVGQPLMDSVHEMRGRPGTQITLTIERAGVAPFDVAIVRDVIRVRAVRWRVEGDVGYVRVVAFNEKVEHGIERALGEIVDALGDSGRGIALDLRNNPGGLFEQSLALADAFLDDGVIVSVRGRDAEKGRSSSADAGDLSGGLPVVVLINGGSASASEIVGAALQDQGRATVMGTRSFGKGSVQTVMPMPLEGALKLTTAYYYTPSGRAIQARGLVPDIELAGTDTANTESRREVDLPGALPPQGEEAKGGQVTLKVDACPPAGEDDKDQVLGCALALLRAGSTEGFLAAVGDGSRL